ncbi:hypothetical protein NHX12_005301, partial [Muraenolepis orangiensis]
MSGRHGGVQRLLQDELGREIPYVHRFNHQLHLVVVHAMSGERAIGDLFNICNVLYVKFTRKPTVAAHYQGNTLKRLLEQRWTGNLATVQIILKSFQDIVELLRHVENSASFPADLRMEAAGLLSRILKPSFKFHTQIICKILSLLEPANRMMQSEETNLQTAVQLVNTAKECVEALRTEKVFTEMWSECAQEREDDIHPGANAKLRYQIMTWNPRGTIFITQTLDFEQTKRYRLHVVASDGKWEDSDTVEVAVVNKNDEPPVFTVNEYYGSVTEELDGSPVFVLQVTASDPDKDANQEALHYSLHGQGASPTSSSCHGDVAESSPAGTSVMEMTATDLDDSAVGHNAVLSYRIVGCLDATTDGAFDRDSYLLVVEARDGGGMMGTRTATIQVKDINDHAPLFKEHSCLARVSEKADINAEVLDLSAVDRDTGENAQLTFNVKFYMVSHRQEQRGSLRLKKRLDYERPSEQRFNLTLKDIAMGTSIARLLASDSDSGQNRDLTYSLLDESNPDGMFTVDQTGVLTVARPLDRETSPQHHLIVVATDHGIPPLMGSATVQLSLLHVNDNGPEFEEVYTRSQNVFGPQNPPFHFSVPGDYRHTNDFYLQDNLNGTASLTALRTFDRERQKEFLIPVVMSDSGVLPKTVTSTLAVTISDQNDHAHLPGEKNIVINSHREPTMVLEKVYSPDPDDWDNKTYLVKGHMPSYFMLNKCTGFMMVKDNAPPGIYQFQVRVIDGVWPDAVSKVTVHVRDLQDEAIHNAGSLRTRVSPDDVSVFSLADVRERTLDVRFAVRAGQSYLQPEKLHGYLAAHKRK